MKGTMARDLVDLPRCELNIPGTTKIIINNCPEISDSKQATYNGENIIGRSSPLHTYSHSADRQINVQFHFFVTKPGDGKKNLGILRAIQSAVYPRPGSGGAPFAPPVICTMKFGDLLALEKLCVVLQSYSVKFPTDVAWTYSSTDKSLCPYRFDVDTQWMTVYTSADLPFNNRIFTTGR